MECYSFILLMICIVGVFLGWFLTESSSFSLPTFSVFLDRKPFNCRPCLTFHLLMIMYSIAAYLMTSWIFWLIGFITSLLVFVVLYLDSKSKIDD